MSNQGYYGQGGTQHGRYPGQQQHSGPGANAYGPVHHSERLGGQAFNYSAHSDSEKHYDELRQLARNAHNSGNHKARDDYNEQAAGYVFRENNAHSAPDVVDLHGLFVPEAENVVKTRIRAAMNQNQDHLHIIVGKGNHSPGHIQKIKPAIERLCEEEKLEFRVEHNEGRIFVNLKGHATGMPPPGDVGANGYGGYTLHGQPHYQQQQHQQHGGGGQHGKPQQNFNMNDAKQAMGILTKCYKTCCTVM